MLFQRLAHIPATLQRKVKQPDRSGKEIGTPWQDAPPTSLFIHLLQDNSWPLVGRLQCRTSAFSPLLAQALNVNPVLGGHGVFRVSICAHPFKEGSQVTRLFVSFNALRNTRVNL